MKRKVLFLWIFILLYPCCHTTFRKIRGNFKVESNVYNLPDFNKLNFYGSMYVDIAQAENFNVTVNLDGNLFEYSEVGIENNTLNSRFKKGVTIGRHKKFFVSVTMPAIEDIKFTGSINAQVKGVNNEEQGLTLVLASSVKLDTDVMLKECKAVFAGSNKITATVKLKRLEIEISGLGTVAVKGKTNELKFIGASLYKLKAFHVKANIAHIELSGLGSAYINVKESLSTHLAGWC